MTQISSMDRAISGSSDGSQSAVSRMVAPALAISDQTRILSPDWYLSSNRPID